MLYAGRPTSQKNGFHTVSEPRKVTRGDPGVAKIDNRPGDYPILTADICQVPNIVLLEWRKCCRVSARDQLQVQS